MPAKCTTCGYHPNGTSKCAFMRISACGCPTLPRRSLPQSAPRQHRTVVAMPLSIAIAASSMLLTTAVPPPRLSAAKNCWRMPRVRASSCSGAYSASGSTRPSSALVSRPQSASAAREASSIIAISGFPERRRYRVSPTPTIATLLPSSAIDDPLPDGARAEQALDLRFVEAGLAQHVAGVLGQSRRAARHQARRGAQLDRLRQRAEAPEHGMLPLGDRRVRLDLGVRENLLEAVHPARADVVLLEQRDPIRPVAGPEDLAERRHHFRAMLDAILHVLELRVLDQVGPADRRRQALPEGIRQAGDDEPAVSRAKRLIRDEVGMAAAELRVLGSSTQRVGRYVCEQREHGVEHRHLDALADAGALALVERAEDPVSGVDSRGDVRHRRGGLDRRAVALTRMPHDATGGLQDEIHPRLLRERAFGPECGDRAVDQARVLGAQLFVAETMAVQNARAEVLDDHAGAQRKPLE